MSHPLCTAVQLALLNILWKWSLQPKAVVGHSSGEIAAAYAAGAFSLESAIRIAFYRKFVTKTIKRNGVIARPLSQIFKEPGLSSVYTSCLVRGKIPSTSRLIAIGQLHCNGVEVDSKALDESAIALRDLPTYAWNHEVAYLKETRMSREYGYRKVPHHDLLCSRILEDNEIEPVWRNTLQLNTLP